MLPPTWRDPEIARLFCLMMSQSGPDRDWLPEITPRYWAHRAGGAALYEGALGRDDGAFIAQRFSRQLRLPHDRS